MRRIPKLRSLSLAMAYWTGIAGEGLRRAPVPRIVTFHGTPTSHAAELERQLRYLRASFTIVPLAQIAAHLTDPEALAGQVAITFDDGLRNNVSVAYPLLKRLGIPATFFICPGLIDERRWLWTHEARRRLRHAGNPDADGYVEWMKTLERAARNRVEEDLRASTPDFVPGAAERHRFDLASWDELRRLDPGLVTIGSHTVTHPILPCETPDGVLREVVESRRMLEARLQRAVELFAYPNDSVSHNVVELVRRHYRAAFQGPARYMGPMQDPHLVPRSPVPRGALRLALALHGSPFVHAAPGMPLAAGAARQVP